MKVRRLEILDSVTRDGETAVMVNTHVVVLSELASAAFALIDGSVDVDDVTRALVEQFGAPPGVDAREATLMLLRDLGGQGLVAVDD